MTCRVLLMCDYFAFPLWTADGGRMLDPSELPLGAATVSALSAWAAEYQSLLTTDFEWRSPAAEAEFEATGQRLWRRVADELGPDWQVGYFSQSERRKLWSTPPAG
jgi:hypothetical protein